MNNPITVQTIVAAPLDQVWECWTGVEHAEGWAFAADEWGAKGIENDLRPGGTIKNHLFAKDGSMSFDFEGVYEEVVPNERLAFTLVDGRRVDVTFTETSAGVSVVERFEAENMHPREVQQEGWQAFLNNFKKYVEGR